MLRVDEPPAPSREEESMLRLLGLASGLLIFTLLSLVNGAGVSRAGASDLLISQVCAGGSLNVTFSWSGNDTRAQNQWLDLTTADNEWQAGTFTSSGNIAPSATVYTWVGAASGTLQWARLSQRYADGMTDPGGTYAFVGLPCGGSGVILPQGGQAPAPTPIAFRGSLLPGMRGAFAELISVSPTFTCCGKST